MHITEVLKNRKIDPVEEFNRIELLLNEKSVLFHRCVRGPLKTWLNEKAFRNLPIRGSFTDIDDMMKGIGVYNSDFHLQIDESGEFFPKLYLYCEVLLNIISLSWDVLEKYDDAKAVAVNISNNIKEIVDKKNKKIEESEHRLIIVENDFVATEAIDAISDNIALACAIMEYNRVLYKGNITRKRDILIKLASYIEPWKDLFETTPYKKLYKDEALFLVNAIDIRHNNKEKDKFIFTDGWTEKDYEKWYDKTFHTLLMVIISKRQMDISKDIEILKQSKKEKI